MAQFEFFGGPSNASLISLCRAIIMKHVGAPDLVKLTLVKQTVLS